MSFRRIVAKRGEACGKLCERYFRRIADFMQCGETRIKLQQVSSFRLANFKDTCISMAVSGLLIAMYSLVVVDLCIVDTGNAVHEQFR